jgi:hypothetical protein
MVLRESVSLISNGKKVHQDTSDRVGRDRDSDQQAGESDHGPGWATVLVIVALVCFAALPRSIVLTGFSPIIIVVSAIVIVLWQFRTE